MPERAPRRFEISARLAGQRLDRVLVTLIEGLGRAAAARLFAAGRVEVAEGGHRRRAAKGEVARVGSWLHVSISDEELDPRALADASVQLTVALERSECIVLDKPAGVATAPLRPAEMGTIANGLVSRYPEMRGLGFGAREPGLCHRLDTGTSGLLLAARSAPAFAELSAAIRSGSIDKRYRLVCSDRCLEEQGRIQCAVVPGRRVRVRPTGTAGARPVTTDYRVLERRGGLALVEATAPRAYRHQIRVSFAFIGAPLVGDAAYGGDETQLTGRHALHASYIGWRGGDVVPSFEVRSALPDELGALLR